MKGKEVQAILDIEAITTLISWDLMKYCELEKYVKTYKVDERPELQGVIRDTFM